MNEQNESEQTTPPTILPVTPDALECPELKPFSYRAHRSLDALHSGRGRARSLFNHSISPGPMGHVHPACCLHTDGPVRPRPIPHRPPAFCARGIAGDYRQLRLVRARHRGGADETSLAQELGINMKHHEIQPDSEYMSEWNAATADPNGAKAKRKTIYIKLHPKPNTPRQTGLRPMHTKQQSQ